jgi:hypothetical protein
MKKTLVCLLLALCLCLSCIMLIACNEDETPDDAPVDVAPGEEEIGKKGEITLFPKEENEVTPNQPNEQLPDSTTRY